jgi:hypothetical protein
MHVPEKAASRITPFTFQPCILIRSLLGHCPVQTYFSMVNDDTSKSMFDCDNTERCEGMRNRIELWIFHQDITNLPSNTPPAYSVGRFAPTPFSVENNLLKGLRSPRESARFQIVSSWLTQGSNSLVIDGQLLDLVTKKSPPITSLI